MIQVVKYHWSHGYKWPLVWNCLHSLADMQFTSCKSLLTWCCWHFGTVVSLASETAGHVLLVWYSELIWPKFLGNGSWLAVTALTMLSRDAFLSLLKSSKVHWKLLSSYCRQLFLLWYHGLVRAQLISCWTRLPSAWALLKLYGCLALANL